MNHINTPLAFLQNPDSSVAVNRGLKDTLAMINNLVELIIFTPKGSFLADPDFGFEYWNHEYANINYKNFNNGQTISAPNNPHCEITKLECQDSIRNSLMAYAPQLKNIIVSMEINATSESDFEDETMKSKHTARVVVEGCVEKELGTTFQYKKEVVFYTEPSLKNRR